MWLAGVSVGQGLAVTTYLCLPEALQRPVRVSCLGRLQLSAALEARTHGHVLRFGGPTIFCRANFESGSAMLCHNISVMALEKLTLAKPRVSRHGRSTNSSPRG